MLIEIVLELVKNRLLRLFVALEIIVVAQALNGLVLFLGERLRYEHAYVDNEIARATSVTLNGWQAFAAQTKRFAWLCARFNLYLYVGSVDGRNFYCAAKNGCRNVKQEVVDDVVAVAHENVVWFLGNVNLNVSVDAVEIGRASCRERV